MEETEERTTQAQSAAQNVSWNDQISTGILRVALYSGWAYKFWRDFLISYVHGQTDWRDAAVAIVCTLFIYTSAAWAMRKWLERRNAPASLPAYVKESV